MVKLGIFSVVGKILTLHVSPEFGVFNCLFRGACSLSKGLTLVSIFLRHFNAVHVALLPVA